MAATERHIRTRRTRPASQTPRPASRPAVQRPEAVGAVVDFQDVVKRYDSGDLGLNGATFAIRAGEFFFIVAASGAGRARIMRLLIRERGPPSGPRRVAGGDLAGSPPNRVPYYRRNLGMV